MDPSAVGVPSSTPPPQQSDGALTSPASVNQTIQRSGFPKVQIDTKLTTKETSLATAALTASVDLLKTPFPPPSAIPRTPSASTTYLSSTAAQLNTSTASASPLALPSSTNSFTIPATPASSSTSSALRDPESPLPTNNSNVQKLERKRNAFVQSVLPRDNNFEGEKSNLAGIGFRPVSNYKEYRTTLKKPADDYAGPLARMTKYVTRTYTRCNPQFDYQTQHNPRRVLTKPSKPSHNDGFDNEDWDYILYVNDILGSQEGQQYQILDILGQGTFGQVVKCQNIKTKAQVAVKVIKNKPAYYNQSLVEVAILDMLNNEYDKQGKHHIVCMKDTFLFRNHLCIIFEMLSVNLYELIKQNQFRGLSTNLVRVFVQQILECLIVLNKARIIHCDLKPENILLKNLDSPTIKVIDFGSACHESQTVYTYIQSRFYRSPEVLMGLPYTSSIDMWSLGCIAAELFLGLPLYPGSSEYNQVSRIAEMLGVPHSYMCEKGKSAHQFFEKIGEGKGQWRLKSMEQYMKETGNAEQPSKRYFAGTTLQEIINAYPVMRKGLTTKEIEKEMQNRLAFIDFLSGLLQLNPLERWSPQQAKMHPFVTGEKFTGPFSPPLLVSKSPSLTGPPMPSDGGAAIIQPPPTTGRRPRANTISSSKVQTVPPQLQRLVAIQQQSGPNKTAVKSSGSSSKEKLAGVPDTLTDIHANDFAAGPFALQKVDELSEAMSETGEVASVDGSQAGRRLSGQVRGGQEEFIVGQVTDNLADMTLGGGRGTDAVPLPSSLQEKPSGGFVLTPGTQHQAGYSPQVAFSAGVDQRGPPLHDLYYAAPGSASPNMMKIPMDSNGPVSNYSAHITASALSSHPPMAYAQQPPFPLRKARSQTLSVQSKQNHLSPSMGNDADLVMKSVDALNHGPFDPSYSLPLGILMDPSISNPNPPDTYPNENHPRTGEKGERKTGLVSRVPSMGLSADWDPFENTESASAASNRSKGFAGSPSATSSKGSRRGSFTQSEIQTIDIGAALGNISRPPQYGASRRSSIPNAPIWPPRHIVASQQNSHMSQGGSNYSRQVQMQPEVAPFGSDRDDPANNLMFSPRAPPTLDDGLFKIDGFRGAGNDRPVQNVNGNDTNFKRPKDSGVNFKEHPSSEGEAMWGYNNTGYPNGPMPNSPYGDPGLSTSPAVRPMQNVGAGPRAAGQLWKQAQHGPMHSPQQPPSFGYHNNGQPMYGGDFRTMYSRPSNTIPNAMVEPPPMSNQPPIYGNGGSPHYFQKRHSVPSLASSYEQHQHNPPQSAHPSQQMYSHYGQYGGGASTGQLNRRGSVSHADRGNFGQFSHTHPSQVYGPNGGMHPINTFVPIDPNASVSAGPYGSGNRPSRTQPIAIPTNIVQHHPHNAFPQQPYQGSLTHHGSMPSIPASVKGDFGYQEGEYLAGRVSAGSGKAPTPDFPSTIGEEDGNV